jgi:hypothetical protein
MTVRAPRTPWRERIRADPRFPDTDAAIITRSLTEPLKAGNPSGVTAV